MLTERVKVKKEIRLDQFIKWAGAVSTGGQAKIIIERRSGEGERQGGKQKGKNPPGRGQG